jgi:hypothetical protein
MRCQELQNKAPFGDDPVFIQSFETANRRA